MPRIKPLLYFILITVPILLVITEPYHQSWIYTYPSRDARQADLIFSYTLTAGISILIMNMYGKRYQLEKDKAEAYSAQLKVLAERDPLTQLYNRNAFSQIFQLSQQRYPILSLAILDLDHFKQLNDRYEHQQGDQALIDFAEKLQTFFETKGHTVSRHGGEEFLILLNQAQAQPLLTEFQDELVLFDPEGKQITFSGGLVELQPNESLRSAIQRADHLLYLAKDQGRNQILTACD